MNIYDWSSGIFKSMSILNLILGVIGLVTGNYIQALIMVVSSLAFVLTSEYIEDLDAEKSSYQHLSSVEVKP